MSEPKRTAYLMWTESDGVHTGHSPTTNVSFRVYMRGFGWAIERRNGSCEMKRTLVNAKALADERARQANCPLLNPPNPDSLKGDKRMRFYESCKIQQLHPVQHPQLVVTVTNSDNPYFDYPVTGVLHMYEIGTDLHVTGAVFHQLLDDGRLGPPCTMENVKFEYRGR